MQGRHAFHAFWEKHVHEIFQEQDFNPGNLQSVFVYELIDGHPPLASIEPDRLLQIMDALGGKK
jgi:hypothetical protein